MASRVPLPDKLRLNKRDPAANKRLFSSRLGVSAGRGGSGGGGEGVKRKDGAEARARTFVDSLPLSILTLSEVSAALKKECDSTFGYGRHVMGGAEWRGATPSNAALLARRLPWPLLAVDGAGDVLDVEHHARNPHVELGTSGRGGRQLHAIANTFAEAVSEWLQAATRVYMGKRHKDDATPPGSFAPATFPTQHAMFIRTPPLQWEVPPPFERKVSRVILRMEDAAAATRFWVAAPVRSAALQPWRAEWHAFCDGVCAAAARATPVPGVGAVLAPIVPSFSHRSDQHGLLGLEHSCVAHDEADGRAVPPATVLDAFLHAFVQFDEKGDAPAGDDRWDEEEAAAADETGEGEGEGEGEEGEDEEEEEGEEGEGEAAGGAGREAAAPRPRRALAFAPDDDLFLAVCDTRVATPLLTVVIRNADLRHFEFRGHVDEDDDDSGGARPDTRTDFVVDWGLLRDKREWLTWSAHM